MGLYIIGLKFCFWLIKKDKIIEVFILIKYLMEYATVIKFSFYIIAVWLNAL